MVVPSNDAFVGNDDPLAIPLFDAFDNLIAQTIIVTGDQVWDAGTEVNDEVPANTVGLGQAMPNTGVDEGGVVSLHGGFIGSEALGGAAGNVLTARPDADLTAAGYEVLQIEIAPAAGNDVIVSGGGDFVDGGGGVDTLDYSASSNPIEVILGTGVELTSTLDE